MVGAPIACWKAVALVAKAPAEQQTVLVPPSLLWLAELVWLAVSAQLVPLAQLALPVLLALQSQLRLLAWLALLAQLALASQIAPLAPLVLPPARTVLLQPLWAQPAQNQSRAELLHLP